MTIPTLTSEVWAEIGRIQMAIAKLPAEAKTQIVNHLPWVHQHPLWTAAGTFVLGFVVKWIF